MSNKFAVCRGSTYEVNLTKDKCIRLIIDALENYASDYGWENALIKSGILEENEIKNISFIETLPPNIKDILETLLENDKKSN